MKPIPLSPTMKLILGTVLAGAIAAVGFLAKAQPQWVWLPILGQALLYVDALLTTPNAAAQRIAELAQKVGSVVVPVALAGLLLTQTACPAAAPVVGPAGSCVTQVIADAIKGMSLDAILKDAGPGCVTDIEEVVTILLGSTDAKVMATPAYLAAKTRRAGESR